MAPLSSLLTVALATGAAAFSPVTPATTTARPSTTKVYENFGFDFAEDQVENTPQIILGEANYKKWLNSVDPDNMLNRQVRDVIRRGRMRMKNVVCVCFLAWLLGMNDWNTWE